MKEIAGGMIMRRAVKYLVLGILLFCGILYAGKAEAARAPIKISKANFPDDLLRKEIKRNDLNQDGSYPAGRREISQSLN